MNTGVQIPLQDNDFLSFEDTPSREIAKSFDKSIFNFLRNCIIFHSGWIHLHSDQHCLTGSLFSTSWKKIIFFYLIDDTHSNRYEVTSLYGFISLKINDANIIHLKKIGNLRGCVCSVTQSCPTLQPHGPYVAHQTPLSINFPGKGTGVGCHFLLQGLFATQESNPHLLCLLHWQVDSLPLSHLGIPISEVNDTFKSEVNDTFIHLIMVVISPCIHISNILYTYYPLNIQKFLFVNYTSVKLGKKIVFLDQSQKCHQNSWA